MDKYTHKLFDQQHKMSESQTIDLQLSLIDPQFKIFLGNDSSDAY